MRTRLEPSPCKDGPKGSNHRWQLKLTECRGGGGVALGDMGPATIQAHNRAAGLPTNGPPTELCPRDAPGTAPADGWGTVTRCRTAQ
jgi:hypothetical protein